jgi:hypothetical protein
LCSLFDSYDDALKSEEQEFRGHGERYILRNINMKVAYGIEKYLAVGENKEELFKLIQKAVEEHISDGVTVYFCRFDECTQITADVTNDVSDMACLHQEAEYMFVAYAAREVRSVMVKSKSGDIDIIAQFVSNINSINGDIYI